MALESATFITELVSTNPVGASDPKSQGDDHLRLLKAVLQATFPGFAGRLFRVQSQGSNYTALLNDNSKLFYTTGTTWTLALTAAATLGNGWAVFLLNDASGDITIDPNAAELVNGGATLAIKPGNAAILFCDGSAFRCIVVPSLLSPNTWAGIQTFSATNIFALSQTWQKQQLFPTATLTDATNIIWDLDIAQSAKVTLAGNRTLNSPTNMKDGGGYTLQVRQDATGGRTLAYGGAYKWPSGVVPVLTPAASAVDIYSFLSDGSIMYGTVSQDIK